jgi:hypothetical protein
VLLVKRTDALKLHMAGRMTYEIMGHGNISAMAAIITPEGDLETSLMEVTTGNAYAELQRHLMSLPYEIAEIAFTSDTYMIHMEDSNEEDIRKYTGPNRVPLRVLFEQGDPNVTEALATIYLSADVQYFINQPYKWTEEKGFEWGEVVSNDGGGNWDFERLITGKPKLDQNGYPICPICGHYIPNDKSPGEYIGALSRRDNKTEICSDCGTREAMEDLLHFLGKEK